MENNEESVKKFLENYMAWSNAGNKLYEGFVVENALIAYANECMPKWIDVKDTKPKANTMVIVFQSPNVFTAMFDDYYEGKPEWTDVNNNEISPTHWMPLPQSPNT